ncbi:helix-turn-helix transcriptional regulator [uncultured Anaerovibrio sp.]|uniref:helix-turn-helix transcriptional regulator n=1 Tax=uncultured Anaerovibrio sp. TaxID=361586 RepID=UPI002601B6D5|nr:helix-turn-helix transcriptional regulator [uncultured Anaerovibrio sp.]
MEKALLERLDEFIKEKYIRPESTVKLMVVSSGDGKVADKKDDKVSKTCEEKPSVKQEKITSISPAEKSPLEQEEKTKERYSISVRDEPVKENWFKRLKKRIDSIFEKEDTFTQRLWKLIDQKGLSDVEVYKRANLDRKLFSKIRNQKSYKPSRGTAIALVIALELSMEETRDLLARTGIVLCRTDKSDVIVAFFIENKQYDMSLINEALEYYGLPILGERKS